MGQTVLQDSEEEAREPILVVHPNYVIDDWNVLFSANRAQLLYLLYNNFSAAIITFF